MIPDYRAMAEDAHNEARELRAQLTAKEADNASLREELAVTKSQVENADTNLEQVRMNARAMWRTKLESCENALKTAEAELAEARRAVEQFQNKASHLSGQLTQAQAGKGQAELQRDRLSQQLAAAQEEASIGKLAVAGYRAWVEYRHDPSEIRLKKHEALNAEFIAVADAAHKAALAPQEEAKP